MDSTSASSEDAAPTELLTGVVGDRCTNCQTPLASDQRYCVSCGERRGKARFSFAAMAAQGPAAQAPAPTPASQRHGRGSGGATLVAGVGTLLLAMGVGVLIGHNSNSTRASAPASQVITIAGGGGGGTAAATPATSSAARATGKVNGVKSTKVKLTPKTTQAAAAAATKVLGAGAPANPTVKQGASCTSGPGCQNGTFTGNFFH